MIRITIRKDRYRCSKTSEQIRDRVANSEENDFLISDREVELQDDRTSGDRTAINLMIMIILGFYWLKQVPDKDRVGL